MKRWFLSAGLALLIAAPGGAATPAFDASVTTSGTASSFVVNLTTSGSNRYIVVDVGYDIGSALPVTAVSYDGVAMVEILVVESDGEQGVSRWSLVNPATGSNPVTVLCSESIKAAIGVRSYTGVNQSTPTGDTGCIAVNASSAAVTVTTIEDNSLVLGAAAWEGSGIITEGASQTERYQTTASGGSPNTRTTILGDDEAKVSAGDVVISYTYSISNPGAICAFVINPVALAGSPTPTCTTTPSPTPGVSVFQRPWPYTGPVYVVAEDTVAYLRMENNTLDEVGIYSWTNQDSVGFSNSIWKVNLFSAGTFTADKRIYSSTNISETIKTIEFYFYLPAGHTDPGRIYYAGTGAATFYVYLWSGPLYVYNGSASAGGFSPSNNTWYHCAVTIETDKTTTLFADNAEIESLAGTYTIANYTHWIGNAYDNVPAAHYMDDVRLSTVVRTNFPTSD